MNGFELSIIQSHQVLGSQAYPFNQSI